MDRPGLINKVKIKLDEFTPEGVGFPFEDYIDPILDESGREILKGSPLHLLTPTAIPTAEVIYDRNKAYIPMPSDYVKLYEIKYPLWEKSVRRTISPEDPLYKIQENEYTKGGYSRPSVAIVQTSVNGGAVTKYFECSKVVNEGGAITPIALYVKSDAPENLNDFFSDAITWLCASKLLGIMGYIDKAKLALEQFSNSLMSLASM